VADFNVDVALVDERAEIVVFNDLVRQDGHRDVHVSIIFGQHGGAQVEIFEIAHHGGGHHTVEEEFGCGQVSCLGTDIVIIVNLVTANHPVDTLWYHFLWAAGSGHRQCAGKWLCGQLGEH